jgi:E3 ubiquitin-protein ligase synoviolin
MADVVIDHEERRRREEEMERLLMEQEEEQELLQQQRQREQDERVDDDELFVRRDDRNRMAHNNVPLVDGNENNNANMVGENIPPVPPPQLLAPPVLPKKPLLDGLFSYRPMSFFACFVLFYYAFRTRRQYYLAMVYLSSSKYAYVIIGNAILALAVSIFDATIHLFVQGLRPHEAEGLQDFFRWNVTETCLALTIFRSELTIGVAVQFVLVILAKCFHHVAAQREEHLRLTEDAVHEYYPFLKPTHLRVMAFLLVLQFADLLTLEYMANTLLKEFPSVRILFAFEAAIMLVSAWSHMYVFFLLCLYYFVVVVVAAYYYAFGFVCVCDLYPQVLLRLWLFGFWVDRKKQF